MGIGSNASETFACQNDPQISFRCLTGFHSMDKKGLEGEGGGGGERRLFVWFVKLECDDVVL